jgi:cation-transporting ATPase I
MSTADARVAVRVAEKPKRRRSIGPRHAWAREGLAHIEVRRADLDDAQAKRLEGAVEASDGVGWAAYNGVLERVVVSFDPTRIKLSDLVGVIERVERQLAEPEPVPGLPDVDPNVANALVLGADLVGAGVGLMGRAAHLPRLPAEFAGLPVALDLLPRLGKGLRGALGSARTDLGLAFLSSGIGAASQTTLATLADAGLRALLLSEDSAQRGAWGRRAADLHHDAASSRAERLPGGDRPGPMADGPIERYAQRIGMITLLAAGGLAALPGNRRRAAQALAIGSPRGARVGREAYAAGLGRLLARRGVVVRDSSALRRLDRIDTVVIDAPVLTTGRSVIGIVVPVHGSAEEARDKAAWLLDGARSATAQTARTQTGGARSPITLGEWALGVPSRVDALTADQLAPALTGSPRESVPPRGEALALTRNGALVAMVHVEAEIDPLGTALVSTARRVGRVLISGGTSDLVRRIGAHDTIAGGSRLADSVRGLQSDGAGVALIAARNDTALAAADCGIGILTSAERRPPWGAHLMAGPGLESAWLVLEAASLARQVSGRSARLALLGSVAGAVLALVDNTPQAARRALTATGGAALANIASGLWSAHALGQRPAPVPEGLIPWHALPIREVLRLLDASTSGLTEEQARQRRSGQAVQKANGQRGLLAAAVAELDTPLTAPLAAGAGISAATGSTTDAILVLSVVLANALLSAGQEMTAGRAMNRLLSAGALRARLHRGDELLLQSADELVSGDVVSLEAGDAVPADCRLITANQLEVDESTLTGESVPVAKDVAPTLAATVADRTCMVYAGTTIAAGTATAIVVAVRSSTEAGRSADMILEDVPTGGVQARLRSMAATSLPVSAAAAAALLLGGLARGRLADSVSASVALAVAAIPEGLPFVATAAELSASKRLAGHNILVRNRRAMEALGRVDVVCFDKTGTLTEGRIQLRAVSDGRRHRAVEEAGTDFRGIVASALRATPTSNGDEVLPHPTDRAVVAGADDAGVSITDEAAGWRMVRELPFEPGRGYHAVLGQLPGAQMISVKGAPEVVLPRCVAWTRDGGMRPLTSRDRREIDAEVDRLAQQGLRVLAIAERTASRRRHLDEDRVDWLVLRGLLGLADTTRPTAAEAVRRLRSAGVDVVMLTGDHPSTAEAIGAELDLLDGGAVVTGPELDETDEEALDALVSKAAVFARVSPAHKVAVVRSLRRAGRVVAVTGDGANDAPAIRLADVGIALGDQGTAAARQAADMIVVDGQIETIADGVIAGRAMWASVRDAVALLLGGNLGEILFTVGSSAISASPALNARQLLFVNLMTDLLPALTVASRTPRGLSVESLAREGPESSLGTALTDEVTRRAIATALGTTGGWLAARFTGTAGRASSVAVASLVASQLAQTAMASHGDPYVLGAVALSFAALVGTVQTPGVSHFFGSRPLGPVGWGTVLGAATAAAAIGAVPTKWLPDMTRGMERLRAAGARVASAAATAAAGARLAEAGAKP